MKKKTVNALLALSLWALAEGSASASGIATANVASRYSECSLVDNGNGTSTASVTIDFNPAENNTNEDIFLSRGLLFNLYDKNGVPQGASSVSASLDGEASQDKEINAGYVLVRGMVGAWDNDQALHARATVNFHNGAMADWPAVFIRAANYVAGQNQVAAMIGGAYITAEANGRCRLVKDPVTPPPFDINITVDAPDWDLGEIDTGMQRIPLDTSQDRLCLKYTDSETSGKPFIINASNQNGMADGRYQLKNLQESSQVIPYELILENGSRQVLLPNNSSASIPLDKGGKTCFSPLFRTFAPKTIQPGDYSDVLTFTVVTPT